MICHEKDQGDVSTHVFQLARSLAERNHGVVVAGPADSWLLQQCRTCGITYHAVPMRGGADLGSYLRVLGIVRKFDIQVLHGHGDRSSMVGAVVARLTRKPAVTTVFSSTGSRHYSLAHRIITASETLRSQLLANRLLAGRIDVVHEGVPDPPSILLEQRGACRQELGLRPSDVAIAMAGSLDSLAGQRLWIDTVGKLRQSHPGVHLYVIGGTDAASTAVLEQRVVDRRLASHVHFMEGRSSLQALLVAMDIFALPAQRDGACLALIEALAFGLPVVATIGAGMSEIVQHGETGLLFARGDGSMLAAMLAMLVEDPAWRAALGANARRCYRECFTLQRMVSETESIYRALVA